MHVGSTFCTDHFGTLVTEQTKTRKIHCHGQKSLLKGQICISTLTRTTIRFHDHHRPSKMSQLRFFFQKFTYQPSHVTCPSHLKETQKNAEGFSPLKLDPQLPQLQQPLDPSPAGGAVGSGCGAAQWQLT